MSDDVHLSLAYNRDHLLGRLIESIAGHMADLNQALRALEDGAFAERAGQSNPKKFVKIVYKGVDVVRTADQRQLYKCCKAIVADFMSFIDAIIAVADVKTTGVPITRDLRGEDEIKKYVEEYIAAEIQRVASDPKLKAPCKIDQCGLSAESVVAANQFCVLRNCLEHRNGIPSVEMSVTLTSLQIVTTTGVVVDGPMILNKGDGLAARRDVEQKKFPRGQKIVLSEEDVRKIAFTVENLAREVLLSGAVPGAVG